MYFIRILPLLIVVQRWTCLLAQLDGSQYENSILVSSLMNGLPSSRIVHINLLPGTLYNAKNVTSVATVRISYSFNTKLESLDIDYARHRVYMFDSNTAKLYALNNFNWETNFAGMTLTVIHDGLSRHSVRLEVDWVSNNLYLTDPLFGWIVVQSLSKTNVYKILLHDALNKPYALAVDPVHKYIFWSDIGPNTKIERASLSGKDRKVIIQTGLYYPTDIAIDYSANKFVWVDSARDTIETANLDGTGRQIIGRSSHTTFNAVAVYKDLVGVTSTKDGSFQVFNKTTGDRIVSLTKTNGQPFLAVALYSADAKPYQEDFCINKGCNDICVNSDDGPECLCREGYKLTGNGLTCTEDLGAFHRAFMWSTKSDICMKDIRGLMSDSYSNSQDCFYTVGTNITWFDIGILVDLLNTSLSQHI